MSSKPKAKAAPSPAPVPDPCAGDGTDYEVGYKKPPKDGQFKPGNKAGKGRPKGALNTKTLAMDALNAKTTVKLGGKVKKLTKAALAFHQLANKASSGDLKAINKAIELHERYGPQEEADEITPEQTAYDLETLIDLLRMSGRLDEETAAGNADDDGDD